MTNQTFLSHARNRHHNSNETRMNKLVSLFETEYGADHPENITAIDSGCVREPANMYKNTSNHQNKKREILAKCRLFVPPENRKKA